MAQIRQANGSVPFARQGTFAPILLSGAALLATFIVFSHRYSHYNLYGDDPGVLGASAGNPRAWFTDGFSRDLLVYPEWFVHLTDFLRPGVNAILRVEQTFFGNHYFFYFLVFYVVQFLTIWIVVWMASRFGIRQRWLLLLALLLAFEPAFFNNGLVCLSFQFDIWCGFLALAAFFFLTRERYVLAIILLTLAVFTKEAALYAPVAAALTVAYATRRMVLAATMLLPLAAWLLVRSFVFSGTGLNGMYVIPDPSINGMGLSALKGLLYWPNGLLQDANVNHFFRLADLVHFPSFAICMIGNVLLWILLLTIGLMLFRRDKPALLSPFTVFIWLLGALSFGVLVARAARFGGSIYPLELLLLAIASSALPPSRWRNASLAALCLMPVTFIWNLSFFSVLIDYQKTDQDVMLHLVDALRHNGQNANLIYVLNSAPSFSPPDDLARLAGIHGHLVVLSQFRGCISGGQGSILFSPTSASELKIEMTLPPCAQVAFLGAGPAISDPPAGTTVLRGNFARYVLPDKRVADRSTLQPWRYAEDFGRRLNITLEGFSPQSTVLLYYDWTTGYYRCLGTQCAAS